MADQKISSGVVHKVPSDLKDKLKSKSDLLEIWNNLTPLARNEWICWVTIVKKEETRENHIKRLEEELLAGIKRPCCWPGCPHRRERVRRNGLNRM
jgi:uncharacterized protein YdeI (YjbR/CyaY-like superfamily)